jgi:pimeloyl-ACP methyl ester carboxylesterase
MREHFILALGLETDSEMKMPGIGSLMPSVSLCTAFTALIAVLASASPFEAAYGVESYDATRTRYIDVKGTQFAYRRFGADHGVPLVLLTHYRASMDNWDPALLDDIAQERTVVVFDNKGVSSTGGMTPGTYGAMADDAADFISALGYKQVDVLGFSIGGAIAQQLLLNHTQLIRKGVLAASMPPGGKGILQSRPDVAAVATKPVVELSDFLVLFFAPTPDSQAEGRSFLTRRSRRTLDIEPETSPQVIEAQGDARKAWSEMDEARGLANLANVQQPVLIANGRDDVMISTPYSFTLFQTLPKGQLILYPNSGHGFLFQYNALFAKHLSLFLGE